MTPLERAFTWEPGSKRIAAYLNARGARTCEHGRDPCILRCGVRTDRRGVWYVIPPRERIEWLRRGVARYSPEDLAELDDGQPSQIPPCAL